MTTKRREYMVFDTPSLEDFEGHINTLAKKGWGVVQASASDHSNVRLIPVRMYMAVLERNVDDDEPA